MYKFDKKPTKIDEWYEVNFNIPKEWYPYFMGNKGLYVLSKNIVYDSPSTITYDNR